jgi:hypothetical protein
VIVYACYVGQAVRLVEVARRLAIGVESIPIAKIRIGLAYRYEATQGHGNQYGSGHFHQGYSGSE